MKCWFKLLGSPLCSESAFCVVVIYSFCLPIMTAVKFSYMRCNSCIDTVCVILPDVEKVVTRLVTFANISDVPWNNIKFKMKLKLYIFLG